MMNSTVNISTFGFKDIIVPSTSFLISLFGILVNIFLILVISSDKKLRSPCFLLISGSAGGSLLMSSAFLIESLAKLGILPFGGIPRIQCKFLQGVIFKSLSVPYNSQVAFLISMDRLYGTIRPLKYRNLKGKHAMFGLMICNIFGLGEFLYLISGVPPHQEIVKECKNSSDLAGKIFMELYAMSNFSFCCMCVIGYSFMLICAKLSKNKIQSETGTGGFPTMAEKSMFWKQQRAIMPAAKLLCALYIVFGVVPEFVFTLGWILPSQLAIISSLAQFFKVSSSLVEMAALTLRSTQFRKSARGLLKKKENKQLPTRQIRNSSQRQP